MMLFGALTRKPLKDKRDFVTVVTTVKLKLLLFPGPSGKVYRKFRFFAVLN